MVNPARSCRSFSWRASCLRLTTDPFFGSTACSPRRSGDTSWQAGTTIWDSHIAGALVARPVSSLTVGELGSRSTISWFVDGASCDGRVLAARAKKKVGTPGWTSPADQ
jgi:hypothetical protein